MTKNKERRWLYVLEIPIMFGYSPFKIGVYTGYVASRIGTMLNQLNHMFSIRLIRAYELEGKIEYNGQKVWLNYAVENQVHSYLNKFRVTLPFNFAGKTECFVGLSQDKVFSAIANAIQWAEKKPRPIPKDAKIIDGRITKYFEKTKKAKKPDFEKQKKKSFQDPKIAERERELRETLKH
jgi:hypothetical protein